MNKRFLFFVFFVVLVVGFSVRWYDLGKESLWNDEAFSVHHASVSAVSGIITQVSITEGAPPGYYILLHYWITLFGTSEVALRSLSVLFGVFSIIILFLLVRLFFSEQVALLSSFFLATSMLQVLFSQEARLYSLFTFLVLLASYVIALIFRCAQRDEKAVFLWLVYLLVMLLTFYVNYLTFFVALSYFLVLFFRWNTFSVLFRRTFIFVHGVLAVLVISLYYLSGNVLIHQFLSLNKGLTNSLIMKHLPSFLAQLGLFFYALPLLLFFGIIFLLLLLWKRRMAITLFTLPDTYFFSMMSLWAVFYVYLCFNTITLFGIHLTQNPITQSYFLIRHSFFLAPLLYVYVAYKICMMRQKVFAGGVIVVILLVNIVALSSYYSQTTKAPWGEAMGYIQENSINSPLLLLDKGGFSNEFLLRRYYPTSDFELIKLTSSEEMRVLDRMGDEKVWQAIGDYEEFWLILYKNTSTKDYYKQLLDMRYIAEEPIYFQGIKIYHYHARNI